MVAQSHEKVKVRILLIKNVNKFRRESRFESGLLHKSVVP